MNKKPELLRVNPENVLVFRGPFDTLVVSHLKLTNLLQDKQVCFKIKTTAPKKYCVRPNCGAIRPGDTVKIMIALQPFDYDPNEKNKHKFMVQSLVSDDEDVDKQFYVTDPELISETKLRCLFEMPENYPEGEHADNKEAKKSPAISASAKLLGEEKGEYEKNVTRVMAEVAPQSATSTSAASRDDNQLQEEADHLRQENLLLNEQLLQLKRSVDSARDSSSGTSSFHRQPNNPYSPPMPALQMQQMKTFYMVGGVLLAILGILIGKFVL